VQAINGNRLHYVKKSIMAKYKNHTDTYRDIYTKIIKYQRLTIAPPDGSDVRPLMVQE
jgi:hypothetical protein